MNTPFSFRRLWAITGKELRHITRDFRVFFLVTLSPAVLLLVLAYLFAFDVGSVRLAWLDQDRSAASRAYLDAITADGVFELMQTPTSYAEVDATLLAGAVEVALVVPPRFESDLAAGRPTTVLVIADGTDSIATSQALGSLAARTEAFGARLAGQPAAPEIRTRAWYNSELKSLFGMVPGLLAIVLTLPALALTLAVTRESEVGTFETLIASPVRGVEYQLGKLIAYVCSGLISASLAAAVAVYWFGVPFRGSFILFLFLTVDFYLACMGVSLLIARSASSQQTAMLLVLFVFFVPGFFVCGLIQPVNTASVGALITSYALPSTHFIAIARGILLKDMSLRQLALHAGLLAAVAGISLTVALVSFRKRLG